MGNTLFYGRNTKNTVEVKPVQVQNDGLEPVKESPVIEVVAAPAVPAAPATPAVPAAPATPVAPAAPVAPVISATPVAPAAPVIICDKVVASERDVHPSTASKEVVQEKILLVKESDSAASSATPSTATSPALNPALDKEMVDSIVKQMNVIDLTESAPPSKKRSKKNRN